MTDEKIMLHGFARGWINTRQVASLSINKNKIELSVWLFGDRYSFLPEQVVSIEKHGVIPFLGWGIRIRHNIKSYPEKIIFWCFRDPGALILKIRDIGFIPAENQTGLPIK